MTLTCHRCNEPFRAGEKIALYNKPQAGTPYHKGTCPTGARSESDARKPQEPIILVTDEAGDAPAPAPAPAPLDLDTIINEPRLLAAFNEAAARAVGVKVDEIALTVLQGVQSVIEAEAQRRAQRIIVRVEPDGTEKKHDLSDMHPSARRVIAHLEAGNIPYLVGPPGGGKSYLGRQLATMYGVPFYDISLSLWTPESRILGALLPSGLVSDPDFRKCWEHGGVYVIDELDNSNPNLVTSLNAALANGHCSFPDRQVPRHPQCYLMMGGNTTMRGGDKAFPERQAMGAATIDRVAYVPFPVDNALERRVALGFCATMAPWIDWFQAVRAWAVVNDPKLVVSPRSTYAFARLLTQGLLTVSEMLDDTLWKLIEPQRIERALTACPVPPGTWGYQA